MNALNFSLYIQRHLVSGYKAMSRLLVSAPAFFSTTHGTPHNSTKPIPIGNPAPFVLPKRTSAAHPTSLKPLRVLRVMEPGQQRTSVGRMVISGRMADVCAELDRLAAREAAMS